MRMMAPSPESVAQLQAAYNESAASTGEFSEQTLKIGYLLTEEEEKLDAASKALKEYQKNNNRANAQANKFKNIISESNAAFSDFGSSLTSLDSPWPGSGQLRAEAND